MSSLPSPNSEFAERFPGLQKLGTGYLNNAWDYLYGTPEAAVAAFAEHHPTLRTSAADGIDALFATYPDEASRDQVLEDLGWGFAGDPGELDALLIWVATELREP